MALAAKHAALLIALGGKPKGGPPDAEGDDDATKDDDMESSAVDDMFEAIESKDRTSFGDALKRYVQACVAKAGNDDDEEGDEHEDY